MWCNAAYWKYFLLKVARNMQNKYEFSGRISPLGPVLTNKLVNNVVIFELNSDWCFNAAELQLISNTNWKHALTAPLSSNQMASTNTYMQQANACM